MIEFKFGTIIAMDLSFGSRALRLMALRPVAAHLQVRMRKETWWATVLIDSGIPGSDAWEVGRIVTVSPGASGIVILEDAIAGET